MEAVGDDSQETIQYGWHFQVERCLTDRKYVQITNNSLTIDAARQDCRGQKADAFSPLSTREHAGGRRSGKQGMLCLCWLSPSRSGLQHFATNVHVCPPFLGNAPGMLDGTTSRGPVAHDTQINSDLSVLRKVICRQDRFTRSTLQSFSSISHQ